MKIIKTIKQIKGWNHVIPALMVLITGHSRYLPEIEWSENLWTHNIFRVYEMIFWRRSGLRPEVLSFSNGRQVCLTFEAMCAYFEGVVRQQLVPVRIMVLRPATVQSMYGVPTPFLFAIAVDSTASGGSAYNHTVSGSQRGMIINTQYRETDTATATATYNTVSATNVTASRSPDGGARQFKLINPDTGTNQIALSQPEPVIGNSISFTGADQTTLVGATNQGFTSSQNGVSYSITTTRANSYTVESQWGQTTSSFGEDQGQTQWGASTVSGQRAGAGAYKAQTTIGAKTLGFGSGVTQVWDWCVVEVMAFVAPVTGGFFMAAAR